MAKFKYLSDKNSKIRKNPMFINNTVYGKKSPEKKKVNIRKLKRKTRNQKNQKLLTKKMCILTQSDCGRVSWIDMFNNQSLSSFIDS